jgi:hypothetical protein
LRSFGYNTPPLAAMVKSIMIQIMSDLIRKSHNVSLFKHFKYSTGVELRLIFSSVVLRADVATGSEGKEVTVFIGYGF